MVRSLWSGVSGLQAHQIAMDVEGHNIANVNTVGYKYARVSFSDQISQTSKIATAPQGQRGGRNPMQVGLGTQVDATTRIFNTGSLHSTGRNTDLAIESDGFFVVSPDGGKTYAYTRNGEFSLDALGNVVTTQGYIVQGWMRNSKTGLIDPTGPIKDLVIPPGLTTEAKMSEYIEIKANLNSGRHVADSKRAISSLDHHHYSYDYNENDKTLKFFSDVNGGNQITPMDPQPTNEPYYDPSKIYYRVDVSGIAGIEKDQTLLITGPDGNITEVVLNDGIIANGYVIGYDNTLLDGPTATVMIHEEREKHDENSEIDFLYNAEQEIIERAFDVGVLFDSNGDSFNLRDEQGIWISKADAVTSSDPIAIQDYTFKINGEEIVYKVDPSTTDPKYVIQGLMDKINQQTALTGVVATTDGTSIILKNDNRTGTKANSKNIRLEGDFPSGLQNVTTAKRFIYSSTSGGVSSSETTNFKTTEDLRQGIQEWLGEHIVVDPNTNLPTGEKRANAEVTVNEKGQFKIKKVPGGDEINVAITAFSSKDVMANKKFARSLQALDGVFSTDNQQRTSQGFFVASHGVSTEIYDSLGSKHSVDIQYTKVEQSKNTGTKWAVKISVAEPGVINNSGNGPENILTGSITFDENGALMTSEPTNISYTPNNGAAPNQNITFNLGTIGGFDGITSYDDDSSTAHAGTDGYPGGDLKGIRFDETGTAIGEFTNGRSFAVAKVALAKFTNNEGLESKGGNMFTQTSNSGDPVIGAANTGGRGAIKAANLEMSNVDLSQSLTQLIVIQRGFQANSKTITTSDQMLNTLLQLKQ